MVVTDIGIRGLSWLLGSLPPGSGQRRIAGEYWKRWRPESQRLIRIRMADGTLAILDLSDRTQAGALLTRRYSPEVVEFVLQRLPANGTFIDLGANVGLISLPVASARPDATVIAFEPHPACADQWRTNRSLNGIENARLEELAVGERVGSATMTLWSDLASGYVTDNGEIPLEVTTLDAYVEAQAISRVDVLKVDVEGNEPRVLDGAARVLNSVDTVIVEINDATLAREGFTSEQVIEPLRDFGFRGVPIPPESGRWRPVSGRADLAFVRD